MDFLTRISTTVGISGYETAVADIIKEEFGKRCDEAYIDKFGNVIGIKKGNGKNDKPDKIMFCAHMDEIGLMVKDIDDNGFIRFSTVGGFDPRTLVSQEVIIHGKNNKLYGVIGIKPPHLTKPDEMKKAIEIEDMSIDAGYSAEKLKDLISIGDAITVKRDVVKLQNEKIAGRAIDDCAGVAALYEAMDNLKNYNHTADVYFVASVQEEIGGRGAKTATYAIQPDIGIAVDVGFAKTPELNEEESIEQDKGPSIGTGINIHPAVFENLREAAKQNNIKYQIEVYSSMSCTDAEDIQISRDGVASGVISIPLKYMHTAIETISAADIIQTGKLLSGFIMQLNDKDMEAVLCY